ncbi:XRE family transcriptional regulator [Chelativorans sp. ZYF759]|uniref:helix-turn-helix domain-containing protein n=1 Tax=Chelativorans sp. ZYF759 TaxID=2692213 RepID=UPI00145C76CF|nr:helix-turn-helix transcriptional regulator [Chelativorans sp. ZYF759]NMG39756.1 XRE family transcriptional regulator [Chelativorans sp. ZYF759]
MDTEVGELLSLVRSQSDKTQKQVADAMKANQTKISRIEAGGGDTVDVAAYLDAIGTSEAQRLKELLSIEWVHIPRPSLRHPDLDALIEIEHGLATVRTFLADETVPSTLANQAALLDKRLESAGQFLLSVDHDVVYVGEIGVGKTTAVCRQTGLVLDEATASDLKGMLLDTGGGRTTICDVRVVTGDRFSMAIEAVPDEEIYRLVAEMGRGIYEKVSGEAGDASVEFKPPEEVERALRNMASLPRPPRARRGVAPAADPAIELAQTFGSREGFVTELGSRLGLWRRKRKTLEFEGIDPQAGRRWLKSTFMAINNGRQDDVSLPARVTVTVPFSLLSDARLAISVVDTRGVDGSAVRPDILDHIKNPRAVNILCSKWGSAPDPSAQALLEHVTETHADPTLLSRAVVLALARAGDALSMRHDSGEAAQDVHEGYDIKLGQVDDALTKVGLNGVEAFAYDASVDDPSALSDFVLGRIRAVRQAQAEAARATVAAIKQMIENRAEAETMAALAEVSATLERFADRSQVLPKKRRGAHERLLAAVTTNHARTVWAATLRNGRFWNFNAFQYLGDGAAGVAKAQSKTVLDSLCAIIDSDMDNPEYTSARSFLEQVRADAQSWEADFVNAVRHQASAVYLQPLSRDQALWDACEDDYGRGVRNYREGVAKLLRQWFDDHPELSEELDRRVARAWETTFIDRLRKAAGQSEDVSHGADGA